MGKKVLVITASPRRGGNSDTLADAFIASATEAGHEAVKFEAAFKEIGGCIACDKCWSKGDACVLPDDFHELEPLLESCETLVISTPLYWFSFPEQIKGIIDRLYAYGGTGGPRPLAIRESLLFVCGEGDEPEEYEPLISAYKMTASFLKWINRGILRIGGVAKPGDIGQTEALEQAAEFGKIL